MNRKGEILNDIDNSNYSIINGAISCTMPILEENSHNFHLFAKMLLLNNFIPEKIVCPNRIDNRVFLYYIIDRERGYLYETKI